MEIMRRLFEEEEGQGMVEYALIIALIAVVVVLALGPLGEAIAQKFEDITGDLGAVAPGGDEGEG